MDFIKYNRPKLPRNKYGIQNSVFYSGGSVFNSLGSGSASGSSVSLANYYTKPETDEIVATKLDKSIWDGVFRIDENGDLRCTTNFIGEKEVSAYGEGETSTSVGGSGIIVVDDLNSSLTDAALSANQGRVLKELIDNKTVDFELTDYAKQDWVSQNFISVIPSEYITETELNTTLSSYYTKSEIDNKGYLTAIPSEYITETELNTAKTNYYTKTEIDNKGFVTTDENVKSTKLENTSNITAYLLGVNSSNTSTSTAYKNASCFILQGNVYSNGYKTATERWVTDQNYLTAIPSEYITETGLNTTLSNYYNKTETDDKLDDKLNKSVWDDVFRIDSDGNLRCTTNFIGEKEVSSYGAGDTASSTVVVVDNLNSSLTDAALSANQGRVLKELIDNKTVDFDLSDYAKQAWVSQNFISVIPSEYITSTELNTALGSYYTKAQIDNKGYLTAIPSEYINSTELNTALSSYYTKTEIDDKGYLTAIPSEYITETELTGKGYVTTDEKVKSTKLENTSYTTAYLLGVNSSATSTSTAYKNASCFILQGNVYSNGLKTATERWVTDQNYLTAIPSEYITETGLNTTLSRYYTKTETDEKLDEKVDKTTWDSLFLIDSNGDLHVKTNLIGEKEVSAYNVGTEDDEDIFEGGSEWYNIHTKRLTSKTTTATDMYVVIENLDDDMVNNPDNYRIVLLTWKRKKGEGNRWRIPMFSPRWLADTGAVVNAKTPCAIAWNNTWWPITGTKTKWWNTTNAKHTDVFDTTVAGTTVSFKNKNKRMRFGCCIMKKMEGVGTYGWQRVSNISEIMLFAITGGKHFCSVK